MKKWKNPLSKNKKEELEKKLQQRAAEGVQVNKKQNTINMCSQMSNIDLWAKEVVANASDAGASLFRMYGIEKDGIQTVICEDNGHGMDKKGITDYFTVYRSRKQAGVAEDRKIHGTHGLGKLTVAKIPKQIRYKIITSTGKETWIASTGSLIECDPIQIARQKEVLPQGTRLEVSFEKSVSLHAYMDRMQKILKDYTRYLSMKIIILLPISENDHSKHELWINEDWKTEYDPATIHKVYSDGYKHFDIVMGIGKGGHEIYQSRILITRQYNLISYDQPQYWSISNLWIRVDSPNFELPFGRHCLMNSFILGPLSALLREKMLPDLIRMVGQSYPDRLEADFGIRKTEFEQLIFSLLLYDDDPRPEWGDLPVFKTVIGENLSLNQLIDVHTEKDIILIEDGEFDGVDFSRFEMPVLSKDQPELALKVIKEYFDDSILKIGEDNLVFEPKKGEGPKLDKDAKRFQEALGFRDGVFGEDMTSGAQNFAAHMSRQNRDHMKGFMSRTAVNESMQAIRDLQLIDWRVNYLVDRDGKTPCTTHMFIFRHEEIILNLYHTEVKKLLELSRKNSNLAGHWATAMCLSDKRNVLPHLSSDLREDLLTVDSMIRAGEKGVDYQRVEEVDPDDYFRYRHRIRNRYGGGFFDFLSMN